MKVFGFNITKQEKEKEHQKSLKPITYKDTVMGRISRRVIEPFTGAWQRNIGWVDENILDEPTVFSCVTTIASSLSKLRPIVVHEKENGTWVEEHDSKLTPLLKNPNHFQNHIQFKENWFFSKMFQGNTYGLKQRDKFGNVRKIFILDPYRTKPLVTESGDVYYQLSIDNLAGIENSSSPYSFIQEIDNLIVPASEIFHDRYNCFYHPLIGISPLTAAYLSASQSLRIRNHSKRFFDNDAVMSGILTAPGNISEETAKLAKEYFEENFTGDNSGGIAVLGDNLKFERMTMSSVDSQLIEQMRYSAEQICSIFHVPHFMILGGGNSQVSNLEMLNQQFYSQCLQSYIEAFEECIDDGLDLNKKNTNNKGVELDLSPLLRMDTAARYASYQTAIKSSFMTINEARAKENLGPVVGGDTIWMQQQNYSTEALMERDENSPLIPQKQTQQPEQPSNKTEESSEDDIELFAESLKRSFKKLEDGNEV